MHLLSLPNVLLMNCITLAINQPHCEFWVSGDFNLPDINWNNPIIKSLKYPKSICHEFHKLPFYCDLEQMMNMPSRGNNIIDLFITTHPTLVDKCVSIPGMGDNDVVLLDILTTPYCNKPIKQKTMLWNKADLSSSKYDFNMFSSNFIFQSFPDVNSCWTVLRNNVIQLMKKYVLNSITHSFKTSAWINTDTRRRIRRKNRPFTKAQLTKRLRDLQRYKHLK